MSHKVSRDKLCSPTVLHTSFSLVRVHTFVSILTLVFWLKIARKKKNIAHFHSHAAIVNDVIRWWSVVGCGDFFGVESRVGPRLNGRLISSSSSSSSPLLFSLNFFSVVSCFVFRFFVIVTFFHLFAFSHCSLFHFISFLVTCSGATENMEL